MDASKLNAEELYYYEMTDDEKEFVDELKDNVEEKAIKLGLINEDDSKEDKAEVLDRLIYLPDTNFNYKDGIGFYYVREENGKYEFMISLDLIEDTVFYIFTNYATRVGFQDEYNSRDKLIEEWKYFEKDGYRYENNGDYKYDITYDGRKYAYEYAIDILSHIYDKDILDEFILEVTNKLNQDFKYEAYWRYDKGEKAFVKIDYEEEYFNETEDVEPDDDIDETDAEEDF